MSGFLSFHRSTHDIPELKKAGNVQGLIHLLNDRNGMVREQAGDALGALGKVALPSLVSCLNSHDVMVRLGAIGAISIIRDPSTVLPVMDLVKADPNIDVRGAALLALGDIGDPTAIPICVETLKDRNRFIRYGSAITLGRLLWEPEDDSMWAYYFIALQDWDRLRSLGSSASCPMREMLKDEDPVVRIQLIDLLSRTGAPDTVNACSALLKDPRDSVRYMTVLSAVKSGMATERMPLLLAGRKRPGPNPAVAALLNLLFLGIGYNYMGKWWGFLLFMSFMSIIVLAQLQMGPFLPYLLAYPVTAVFAVQTYREAKRMVDG